VDPTADLNDMEKGKFLTQPGLELRSLGLPAEHAIPAHMVVCRHVEVETSIRWRRGGTCYIMDGGGSSAYLSYLHRWKIPPCRWQRK
jgi:hypothetical protein